MKAYELRPGLNHETKDVSIRSTRYSDDTIGVEIIYTGKDNNLPVCVKVAMNPEDAANLIASIAQSIASAIR